MKFKRSCITIELDDDRRKKVKENKDIGCVNRDNNFQFDSIRNEDQFIFSDTEAAISSILTNFSQQRHLNYILRGVLKHQISFIIHNKTQINVELEELKNNFRYRILYCFLDKTECDFVIHTNFYLSYLDDMIHHYESETPQGSGNISNVPDSITFSNQQSSLRKFRYWILHCPEKSITKMKLRTGKLEANRIFTSNKIGLAEDTNEAPSTGFYNSEDISMTDEEIQYILSIGYLRRRDSNGAFDADVYWFSHPHVRMPL
jgi:hypothetical protein